MIILTFINKIFMKITKHDEKYIGNLFNKCNNYILHIYNENYSYEYIKFKDYFIEYYYNKNNLVEIRYFNYLVKLHRDDGPAYIEYLRNGGKSETSYYLNGKYYSYENYVLEIKKLV